jgi:hypothetical protein
MEPEPSALRRWLPFFFVIGGGQLVAVVLFDIGFLLWRLTIR